MPAACARGDFGPQVGPFPPTDIFRRIHPGGTVSTRSLVAQLADRLVQHLITGTRPVLATDGVDLATWKTGGAYGPVSAAIYFDGSAPATLTAPTGGAIGVELWGLKLGQWWLIGALNAGAAIVIVSETLGSTLQVEGVGGFDRLFVAGTSSAGAATAQLVPLEVLR